MNISNISESKFRNRFEYKMSKLNDEKLERIQRILIKRICKLEADTLDFYDYKNTSKNLKKNKLHETY